MKQIIFQTVMFLLVVNMLLLISGYRVLMGQTVVQPGQSYVVDPWGDLGEKKSPTLACEYWTGIGMKVAIWQYGTGLTSKTKCTYIFKAA